MNKLGKAATVTAGAAIAAVTLLPGIASAQVHDQARDQLAVQSHPGQVIDQQAVQSHPGQVIDQQAVGVNGQLIRINSTGSNSDITEALVAGGVVAVLVGAGGIFVARRRASVKA